MLNLSNITSDPFVLIKIKNFNDIVKDPDLFSQLRSLTLNPDSGMNCEMDHIEFNSKLRKVNAQAILGYCSNELISWALYSEEPTDFYFTHTLGFNPDDGVLFEVYVHPEYRRMGIASKLINVARRMAGSKKLCVSPWDQNSRNFFDNFKHLDCKLL